jgi:hypothetical protein
MPLRPSEAPVGGQAGMRQFVTPNNRAHRLATATIPIMTLALIGNVFVMAVSEYGFSRFV